MKRFSLKKMPLRAKLLVYFLVFGAIILIVLWVFQSFFLKPLYTVSKSMKVEKGATQISKAVQHSKNVFATVDNVASEYTLTVYLYDVGGGKPEFSRKCSYENPTIRLELEYKDVLKYYEKTVDHGGKCSFVDSNDAEDMARKRIDIMSQSVSSADSFIAQARQTTDSENESLVYTYIIPRKDGRQTFLIITSSITPLNTTIEVIRNQLLLVSVAFILLSIIFSLYASRRIAKPIARTNNAAKQLAKKNYAVDFNAKGYREVEELNQTLNYARTELAATEKLQRELIANISHDLRTPLTMITGYGEVMRDLPGENTPENIQIIIDEATRLSTLVNDLLDLSKLQSGALQAEKKVFCLTDSVRDILTRYSKLVEQDGFDITFSCDEDAYINADELRISQVIYNLVNNAVNHCGDDKTVIITQTIKDRRVRIEVTDHGEGIPADKLPYIWERYYKVDKEHKRGVIGSGLGLSIVKSILDAHNARYGVRSAVGKGSTFWFEMATANTKRRKNSDKDK